MTFPLSSLSHQLMADSDKSPRARPVPRGKVRKKYGREKYFSTPKASLEKWEGAPVLIEVRLSPPGLFLLPHSVYFTAAAATGRHGSWYYNLFGSPGLSGTANKVFLLFPAQQLSSSW